MITRVCNGIVIFKSKYAVAGSQYSLTLSFVFKGPRDIRYFACLLRTQIDYYVVVRASGGQ